MNRAILMSIVLAATPFGLACEKTAADQQTKANEAQEQANRQIGQANAQANEAQRAANQKIAAAEGEFLRMRDDYRTKTQTNLNDLDGKIAKLDTKSASSDKAKAELQVKLPAIHAQRDVLANDLRSIDMATSATFDATKTRIDKEFSDLETLIDKH